MRSILMDTSAWVALMDAEDHHHESAVEAATSLAPSTRRIITWGILSETYTWLRYHHGHLMGQRWLHEVGIAMTRGSIEMVYPDTEIDARIGRELARYSDQVLSYVDAFSLVVARDRVDIDAVFAFDHHMYLAGLPVLPT